MNGPVSVWTRQTRKPYILDSVAATLLYKVSPSDPVTYTGVAIVLGSIALLASYAPVRRATSVDPVTALRLD